MAYSIDEKENQNPIWVNSKKALNQLLFSMRRNSLAPAPVQKPPTRRRVSLSVLPNFTTKIHKDFTFTDNIVVPDKISLLSDEILLKILSLVPKSQRNGNFLVSKRWLNLQGRLVRSIKLLDWEFLVSGRLLSRFPNLVHVDLVNGCLVSCKNSGISCSSKFAPFRVAYDVGCGKDCFFGEGSVLDGEEVDKGLRVLASGCPNLRRLAVINVGELGLLSVAEECRTLQELQLHMCNDRVLVGIAGFENLQILRLSGIVDGVYGSLVSDVGLKVLAKGCRRLVKLELSGCGGSYVGIKAIGQCCRMLEELTFCNHKMEDGWLLALTYCENLKTLRFMSCKKIDSSFLLDEGSCAALECLSLEKCQLRDKRSLRALFLLCQNVREVLLKNCWGVDDDMFRTATLFRKVTLLSLEGCSLLTTHGLEVVIVHCNELQTLRVKSCNNIKDHEVSPSLSSVFSTLKCLKWKPDTKCLLSDNLSGTGMRKRGGKFFKKYVDWKSLPVA